MADGLVSSIMLICAILASMAVGVLSAHAICVGMFAIFRTHQRQVAAARIAKPQTSRLEAQRS
jgi:hypothetical protein